MAEEVQARSQIGGHQICSFSVASVLSAQRYPSRL